LVKKVEGEKKPALPPTALVTRSYARSKGLLATD
jgi:hypothetical protein